MLMTRSIACLGDEYVMLVSLKVPSGPFIHSNGTVEQFAMGSTLHYKIYILHYT